MSTLQENRNLRWIGNIALLAVTVVWGATFTLTKAALADISVFSFLSVRFVIAGLLLIVIALVSPAARKSFNRRALVVGTFLGLVLFVVYAFQTIGLQYTTPSKAGFLTGLFVIFVPILAIPMLHHRPPARSFAGAVIAATGLFMLCGVDLIHLATGDILMILCAVAIAVQILAIDKYACDSQPLVIATVEICVLALCCTTTNFVLHGWQAWSPLAVWQDKIVIVSILVCAIPATALAFWAQNSFQQYTTPAQTAIIFSMEPVFSAVFAWFVVADRLPRIAILGCALMFLSSIIAEPSIRFEWRRESRSASL